MEWERWAPWMDRIRQDFGYSEPADLGAAQDLEALLGREDAAPVVDYAWNILRKAKVRVLGAADTALDDVKRLGRKGPVVAAGGATTAARQAGRVPEIVVTDLDGAVEDQVWAAEHGALVFIHAHGDNRDALRTWVPRFPGNLLAGTCQVRAFGRLINPGGFTDGDRACFLAHAMRPKRVELLGFDLDGPVGRLSGSGADDAKKRKLEWCGRLLGFLQDEGLAFRPPVASPATHSV